MRLEYFAACAATAALLAGCAHSGANYAPMVDMRPGQEQSYAKDLAECQNYARQTPGAGSHAAGGAVGGALLGAVIGSVTRTRAYRTDMATVGAITGGLSGAGSGANSQQNIVRRCMVGRGYNVLN